MFDRFRKYPRVTHKKLYKSLTVTRTVKRERERDIPDVIENDVALRCV